MEARVQALPICSVTLNSNVTSVSDEFNVTFRWSVKYKMRNQAIYCAIIYYVVETILCREYDHKKYIYVGN